MHFIEGEIYHIYNRGNQKQTIFYSRDNYIFFLEKVKKFISSRCNILSWSLMPNHFHFLIKATGISVMPIPKAIIPTQDLTEGIRLLLSSYTKGLNKQLNLTGNLFQQKTRAKCTSLVAASKVSDTFKVSDTLDYSTIAFHYIHQNAWKAGLVTKIEDWEFSSFRDYCGLRNGNLCNKEIAFQELNINKETIYNDSYNSINHTELKMIF
ncbi:MAG TPA: transposase [Chitinophagaceae bacterium]|nr:transposase [Chitinophagaceae bacterium]